MVNSCHTKLALSHWCKEMVKLSAWLSMPKNWVVSSLSLSTIGSLEAVNTGEYDANDYDHLRGSGKFPTRPTSRPETQ